MPPPWYQNPVSPGPYFAQGYVTPAWGYQAAAETANGLLSPPRSASPFMHSGPPVPYPGQYYQNPPPPPQFAGYPSPMGHGHSPSFPHSLAMTTLPPAPGSTPPGPSRPNGFPVLPPIRPRSSSRRTTSSDGVTSPISAGDDDDDDDGREVPEQLMSAILKNPKSISSSGRSSRAGSHRSGGVSRPASEKGSDGGGGSPVTLET